MATYAKESDLKTFAAMTPAEDAYVNAVERGDKNLAELEAAIRGEKRPEARAALLDAQAKLGAPATVASSSTVTPTKASSSTSVRWKEPGASAVEVKGQLATLQANQAATLAQLQQAITGSQAATDQIVAGEKVLGQSQGASINAAAQVDVARLMQQSAIRDVFHASIIDPNSRIVTAQRQREEAQTTMDTLRAKINAEDQVMPWDDPLRWVVNQFTLPTMKTAYNAAHAKDKQMVREIADTQARVGAQMQIDGGNVIEQIKAKAAADATAAAATASINAARALGSQSSIIAQSLMQKMSLNQQDFNNNMEVAKMFTQSFMIGEQDRSDATIQPTLDALNLKRASVGLPEFKLGEFKQLAAADKSKLMLNAKIPSYGADIGESYRWLADNGALTTVAQSNPTVYNFIAARMNSKDYKTAEQQVRANPKMMNLGTDELRAATLTQMQANQTAEIAKKNNSSNNLDDNNPYKFKPLNAALFNELKDNIFTSVAADIAANTPGGKVDDEAMMLRLLAKAEAEPARLAAFAKQFSDFYRTGTQLQWERSGAKVVGYPAPIGYGISGVLTDATGVATQTWTPAAVEHWIMKNLQERKGGDWKRDITGQVIGPNPLKNIQPGGQ